MEIGRQRQCRKGAADRAAEPWHAHPAGWRTSVSLRLSQRLLPASAFSAHARGSPGRDWAWRNQSSACSHCPQAWQALSRALQVKASHGTPAPPMSSNIDSTRSQCWPSPAGKRATAAQAVSTQTALAGQRGEPAQVRGSTACL